MPPKKNVVVERKPIIGRMGTNLRMGVVGLPNVGKSTFFNTLTKLSAAADNFPFCTIDPNEGRVPVPDSRFDFLCEAFKPVSKVPAYLNVTDIAGLVKGAAEGQGLGNAFLSHIKACDGIFHMVRVFDDEDITHVEGDVNPIRDIEIINNELRYKDREFLDKVWREADTRYNRANDKTWKCDFETLSKLKEMFSEDQKKWAKQNDWNEKEIEVLNKHLFLTTKPVIYLLNMTEKEYIKKKNKWLVKIKTWIDENDKGALCIPFSSQYEATLAAFDSDEQREAYIKENAAPSCMDKIITNGYKALHLSYFFTSGADEVKCWTIQQGFTAPKAAGRIHGDFEKGFIMADVMKFNDFKEHGSELAVKAAGKYRQQGKNYVVEDGDIIFFKFNAGAGLSDKKK